jgi:hypothetical protein
MMRNFIMTALVVIILVLEAAPAAWAATYYVSSSTGSDTNSGTASTAAWQTIAHVNAQTFQPGDSILFRRGDVWNESLAPPSSGTSGNPIAFDAYGNGPAPNLTGYYAVPTSQWEFVTGNAWKAPVPSTYSTVNFCLFGSVWGQKVSAVSSNLTAQWDFYLANGYIYVYSVGNPATFYNAPIVPMALSNVPVINISGKTWLTFQHFLVNWFDDEGVYVQGTSDHLVFANMEADSMIPQGAQPLGFYVNESTPGPGDIKIYNSEAHLNYDGFRFDGAATAITMVNDKGYANRDSGLVDNTGAVTYSYCHFYASSLAIASSTDVLATTGPGPTAGAGNIAADTPPAVQVWQRYPARVTLTVDDEGMTPGADTYYASTVLPIADAAGVPVGAAITVGYALAQTLISEFQGWINAGRDVTSHSISHTYYTNTDALDIQYTGSGAAAALSISSQTLTITVTGASDSVSYSLTRGQPQGTIEGLRSALLATGKFTATEATPCQGPYGTGCSAYTQSALLAQDLADVSGQDVKSSVYSMQLNVTRLTTDEITLSRNWMTTNLTGLPATPVYVYPGGYEDPNMEAITAGVPYVGARGALHEGGTANNGQPIVGAKDTYANGFNVQDITSFGVNPSWQGLAPASLNQKIQALVWKEQVWGVPWGIFWHYQELSSTEITNMIQDFKNGGATILTNTALVNLLLGGTLETGSDGNTYYKSPTASMTLDFAPTVNSPVVDAGENLGAAYELDINGVNQNSYGTGWEIGAHVFAGYSFYGGGGGGSHFTLGLGTAPNYSRARTDTSMAQLITPTPNMGGLVGAGSCQTPADFSLPVCRMTDSTLDPSRADESLLTTSSGSGDLNLWNTNSSMLVIQGTGGWVYPLAFNASTMQASRLYPTASGWTSSGGFYFTGDSPTFSYGNPTVLYVMNIADNLAEIDSYNFSGYNTGGGVPSMSVFFSFIAGTTGSWGTTSANCLSSGYAKTWDSFGEESKNPADQVFLAAFSQAGVQDTGVDVVAYKVGSGCTYLNTSTGVVTGDWGGTGTVGIADRFKVHNVKISKNGQWAMITPAACLTTCTDESSSPYMWQIGTLNLYPGCVTPNSCSGHWTEGFSHFINDDNSPTWQEVTRVYGSNSTGTNIPMGLPMGSSNCASGFTGVGEHENWSDVDSGDTYPFFATTYLASPPLNPYTCAWIDEVLGIVPGSGTVYRFAHTYNSDQNSNFAVGIAVGSVSQDGNFYMWSSDWQGTLGSTSGGSTCTLTSNCRGDVFVVGLTK